MLEKSAHLPVNHRYFGSQFQLWRHDAGVSREELAEAVQYSVELIKSVEQGRRRVPARVAEIADEMFGARGKLKAGLSYLDNGKFPARSHDFMNLEREAVSFWSYENALIPGLLQTEEYARRLIEDRRPSLDDDVVEARIAARLERQQLLARKPRVDFCFVLYEAVLRAPLGGREAHKQQLQRLLSVAELRNVCLQVLPFAQVFSDALSGPMVLLETKENGRFALAEGQAMSNLSSGADEVRLLTERYGMIRAQALASGDSARFIERMVDEL
ncbi:helix-turn-helix transcriptional regulator [Streptomyces sp. NPDC021096]|uniref:helix-turn-helix domain-containing protein n=1 Tax=Streptomyces sp. NPDC021096 TaxID=3154792 RepID=UPI0033C84AF6